MSKFPLTITDAALSEVRNLLVQKGDCDVVGIRIGVKSGGCSGLSYFIEYTKEIGPFDEVVSFEDVKILIDPKALMYLIGTEMDYLSEDFKSGFVFKNPNEKNKCGCGKSFNV
jgi:iron-sulfur cluster assembly accessory protein